MTDPLPPTPAAAARPRWIRAQDVVWILLFTAVAAVSPTKTPEEILMLVSLGAFQVLEPRVAWLSTDRGVIVSILAKLALCYLLIGWTGAISSSYYVILLVPVLSAATTLSLAGSVGVALLACFAYLSFLLFVDWSRYDFAPEAFGEIGLRVIFLPAVAFLTHQLAEANRTEARRSRAYAAELEKANTSLQAAEAAIRRSDRLAALGQLTAGLAHELRNPLGTVRASAEMLGKNIPGENELAKELAGFIVSEVDRTNSLITRFLEFARPLKLRMADVEVSSLVDAAIEELRRKSPPVDVAVHRNYSPDIPRIPGDPELLQRVVYNLLLNAAEATPAGGSVSVKTRAAGGNVEIAVIDRGEGIQARDMESIFNPFFTTKSQGVGLGLAIVAKIVDEHGGRITVDSDPGEGTTFRVFLPNRRPGRT